MLLISLFVFWVILLTYSLSVKLKIWANIMLPINKGELKIFILEQNFKRSYNIYKRLSYKNLSIFALHLAKLSNCVEHRNLTKSQLKGVIWV